MPTCAHACQTKATHCLLSDLRSRNIPMDLEKRLLYSNQVVDEDGSARAGKEGGLWRSACGRFHRRLLPAAARERARAFWLRLLLVCRATPVCPSPLFNRTGLLSPSRASGARVDFERLGVLQKVEVFQDALAKTQGQDLSRMLWLRSPSSEVEQASGRGRETQRGEVFLVTASPVATENASSRGSGLRSRSAPLSVPVVIWLCFTIAHGCSRLPSPFPPLAAPPA